MNKIVQTYLGDDVYVEWNGHCISLVIKNRGIITDAIDLEPEVFDGLVDWVNKVKKYKIEQKSSK